MASPRSTLLKTLGGIVGILASIATILGVLVGIGVVHVPGVGPQPTPIPTATATPRPLTATEILDKAKVAPFKDMSGTLSGSVTVDTTTVQITGQIVFTAQPARTFTEITAQAGTTTDTEDTINDGTNTYTKDTPPDTALWHKCTSSSGPVNLPTLVSLYDSLTDPALVGQETVTNRATYHLRSTETSGTYDVWIRADNFYLAKLALTADNGNENIVFTFTDWDVGTTINLPDPTQVVAC